jgi:bifunctional N-acetylglucosamine-1-phosphate-uridyltransferase/glucosamine-1-phosphate-acetyltransferase GlmU-like protein
VQSRDIVLIIPAAGAGTRLRTDATNRSGGQARLQSSTPKVLSPVNGRPMIDHLFDRYRHAVQRIVLVVHPSFEHDVRRHVEQAAPPVDVEYAHQLQPTGMLDAILLASDRARKAPPDRVWITWCDQIGVHPDTIGTLARLSRERAEVPAIFPTARQAPPYIHLERDDEGRIIAIRQRREGDTMPPVGESDMGLFSLSTEAYFDLLPEFGREAAQAAATRERNFLPFMPWLAQRGHSVLTFPSTNELEAIGVNTPEDRRRLEAYLRDLERQ